jgi:hypothetical protein
MKKSIVKMACALVLALGMTSCGTVGLVGAVYTGYTEPAAVTSNELGTKVGQASAVSVLGVAAAGDAGINEAAKKAGYAKTSLALTASFRGMVYNFSFMIGHLSFLTK